MGKDKNAPKRNLSAYMLFANSKRKALTKSQPNLKMTEQSGVIGKMWAKATASDKKPFEKQAATLKAKYMKAMAKYRETPEFRAFHDSKGSKDLVKSVCKKYGIKARGKKGRFPTDPNAPKRPSSSFFLFANDNRPRIAKKHDGVAAVGKALGMEWKKVSADVKSKYEAKAKKAKSAYATKLAKYQKTSKYSKFQEARAEFNKLKKKM